ncbi:hypothetical protein G6F56_005580 [Rhizopus delemar]|nr:hypothetical protein G6F56_005580 [Rhizopus delemar]
MEKIRILKPSDPDRLESTKASGSLFRSHSAKEAQETHRLSAQFPYFILSNSNNKLCHTTASHPTTSTTSTKHGTHLELENNIVTITRAAIDDDTIGEPWIVNEKDVASLFKRYQHAIHDMVEQHTTLPLESYIYELAALTNVLVVCKNQHNVIAEKIFTLNLLKYLNDKPASDLIRNFELGQEDDLAINTYIIQLIHLRWTNTIPSEKGKPRPNAVICEKPQTNFKCSVGFGEAKVYQGSGSSSPSVTGMPAELLHVGNSQPPPQYSRLLLATLQKDFPAGYYQVSLQNHSFDA